MDMEKRKNEDYMSENFPDLKEMIDTKNDFYKWFGDRKNIRKIKEIEKQNLVAKYILSKNENVYINKEVLNSFQIPKEFVEKVNINSHIIKSHLKMFDDDLYKLTSKDAKKTNQSEKTICKRLWQQTFEYNRYKKGIKPNKKIDILDFEVPVIYSHKCSSNGAIDIVAKDGKVLYLIEAKDYKSEESILRCITEIKTYYEKIINHESKNINYISSACLIKDSYGISKIKPAIMIFENTQPYKDLNEINNHKYLKKLAKGITFFKIKSKKCLDGERSILVNKLKSLDFTYEEIKLK